MRILLIGLFSLLMVSGCSLGLDDRDVQNEEINRQSNRLDKLGTTVKGVYEGSLYHVDGNTYPIQLRLYYVDEIAGTDENGDIYTLPRLKGQLRYKYFVYSNEEREFEVKFDETGNFQMIYQAPSVGIDSDSIKGNWSNSRVVAEWRSNGLIGSLEVARISNVVPRIEEAERRERLRNQFESIIGYYQGELYSFRDPNDKYGDLNITIDYDVTADVRSLIARFEVPENVVFQEFQRIPINWDPRTKIIDFDYVNGKARLTGSGTLDESGLNIEKIRVVAEPFIYKGISVTKD
ncbi:MAG: hypothetical protein VX642_10165 [Bdellovibrionota bacterium]|nr:hypothetical protein [Bdellovibrionota bacterium]